MGRSNWFADKRPLPFPTSVALVNVHSSYWSRHQQQKASVWSVSSYKSAISDKKCQISEASKIYFGVKRILYLDIIQYTG